MEATYKITVEADADTVFTHMTDPALLSKWWPSGAETDLRVGGTYHLWWEGPDWHLRGEYLEIDPPNNVRWTWKWDHDELPPREVAITITGRVDTTEIEIIHEAGSPEERDSYLEGWSHFLGILGDLLENR